MEGSRMNWFAIALVILMACACVDDIANCQWWRAVYFGAGAILNVAVLGMAAN